MQQALSDDITFTFSPGSVDNLEPSLDWLLPSQYITTHLSAPQCLSSHLSTPQGQGQGLQRRDSTTAPIDIAGAKTHHVQSDFLVGSCPAELNSGWYSLACTSGSGSGRSHSRGSWLTGTPDQGSDSDEEEDVLDRLHRACVTRRRSRATLSGNAASAQHAAGSSMAEEAGEAGDGSACWPFKTTPSASSYCQSGRSSLADSITSWLQDKPTPQAEPQTGAGDVQAGGTPQAPLLQPAVGGSAAQDLQQQRCTQQHEGSTSAAVGGSQVDPGAGMWGVSASWLHKAWQGLGSILPSTSVLYSQQMTAAAATTNSSSNTNISGSSSGFGAGAAGKQDLGDAALLWGYQLGRPGGNARDMLAAAESKAAHAGVHNEDDYDRWHMRMLMEQLVLIAVCMIAILSVYMW